MNPKIPIPEKELVNYLETIGIYTTLVQSAFDTAKSSHGSQKTKDGSSYLENHLYPVLVDILGNYNGDKIENIIVIALLHDVLEDDPEMSEDKLSELFPEYIVESVKTLTRQEPEISKQQYMQKITESDYEIQFIKLADRIVNLELVERLRNSHPEKFGNYIKETEELFLPLCELVSKSYLNRLKSKLAEFEYIPTSEKKEFWDMTIRAPIVGQAIEYVNHGTALDLGAGEGRNSFFLADNGFDVLAVDVNKSSIAVIEKHNQDYGTKIETMLCDVRSFTTKNKYEFVTSIMVLHFLQSQQEVESSIRSMQQMTKPGGINVVSAYTDKNEANKRPYLFKTNELRDYYAGWDIKLYEEKPTLWFQMSDEDKPRRNQGVYLIAIKPE